MQSVTLRMLLEQRLNLNNVVARDAHKGHERGDIPGHPGQWVIQRVKLQKVHSIFDVSQFVKML